MNKPKVVITDYYYESIHQEAAVMAEMGAELLDYHCQTEDEVIAVASDCDALICQFAPITRRVIESLTRCRVIVRYAIGVDNIDAVSYTHLEVHKSRVLHPGSVRCDDLRLHCYQ